MQKRRAIREKLLLGALLVGVMVAVLSASSFLGVYSYRRLVRALSSRAAELPRASELGECVGLLRLSHARALADDARGHDFIGQLPVARDALQGYCAELEEGEIENTPFGDRSRELATTQHIADCLATIEARVGLPAEEAGPATAAIAGRRQMLLDVAPHLDRLAALTAELPSYLQDGLHDLSHEVRTGYRTLIVTTWTAALAAAVLLAAIAVLTYRWVFRPLRMLGHGSRRVAAGDFGYRIHLDTRDEMAELAEAFNDMTERFQAIRDDLDRQVQSRTREVIRSEQLASVGFLAAGVAHEINNPLASIAMCAESLESRLADLAPAADDARVVRRYLELIQTEAFRCKGITEKLLDFSRLGEVRRQPTAVMRLVTDVAEMLRHVGRFAGRTIETDPGPDVLVMVNPQEIKQVVLNLLVNALDSVAEAGRVTVAARRSGGECVLTFTDDGCGMTDEVLEHLFEPFFTRRKAGQGTGLGLSIVHRIVADHGGRIEATSAGPGQGATFRVALPLADVAAEPVRGRDAAGRAA
ncbi:MAG: ATP-binding protein [Planctomycetaceae bacterium]|nr:ATP-binding protein [Planctomycetaceae bacterium]